MSADLLTDEKIETGLAELPGWSRDGDTITATYRSPSFPDAIALVDVVAEQAEAMNHHPDIDIRWRNTTWALSTHDAGGLTDLDFELAGRIVAAASDGGAEATD